MFIFWRGCWQTDLQASCRRSRIAFSPSASRMAVFKCTDFPGVFQLQCCWVLSTSQTVLNEPSFTLCPPRVTQALIYMRPLKLQPEITPQTPQPILWAWVGSFTKLNREVLPHKLQGQLASESSLTPQLSHSQAQAFMEVFNGVQ